MRYTQFSQYLDIISILCIILVSGVFVGITIKSIVKHLKKKKEMILRRAPKEEVHGVIFGKKGRKLVFRPENSEGHVLVCASTGKGKTRAVLLPTLEHWQGTSYNIDISGDIAANIGKKKREDDKNTLPMLVYAPESDDTAPYNIFGPIDDLKSPKAKIDALTKLAILLMPPEKNPSSAAIYFYEHGLKILKASLIAFYDQMDFIEIVDKIVNSDYLTLFRDIVKTNNPTAISLINCFHSISEQNIGGSKQSCDNALELYSSNEYVKQSIRRPKEGETALEPKLLETHNLFFVVSEPALDDLPPLMNLVTSQMMQYISARRITQNSKQILISLDEFRSLNLNITLIMGAVERFRKRRCTVLVLLQNIASLNYLYGNDGARPILANFDYTVLLGGLNDPASRQYFADLIGYKRQKKVSTSKNSTSTTTTESWELKYCIEPADLDKQGKNTAILIANEAKNGYMKLKKNFFSEK